MPSDDGDRDGEGDRDRAQRPDRDRATGFSFQLPPFRLPDFFPADFHVSLPVPVHDGRRVDPRVVWVACLAFDAGDAALALTTDSVLVGVARTGGGAALATSVANVAGMLYVWEFAAVLFGHTEVTAVPTLTLLLAFRLLR